MAGLCWQQGIGGGMGRGWRWLKVSKILLFLKKKKQKDFCPFGPGARQALGIRDEKFFGSFFQKRTCLLS
jgi:hypothetical protein